jgi:PAS domain S-box-containing protein
MKPNAPSPTILVVEDNPITRKLLRVTLSSNGYMVLEAPDGRTALRLLANHAPDLVLQDLLLPDMNGFELVPQMRALPGGVSIPIVAISGLLAESDQARARQVGFTDYLFKPVNVAHLLSTLASYLRPQYRDPTRPGRGKRVLVADDDPVEAKLLKIQLEQLGFEVVTAADGVEAVELARAHPPHAIISDVLMPRLDGFRVCLAVRQDETLASIPVLLVSAVYTERGDTELARAVGATAFVLRTSDHRELLEALLAGLGQSSEPIAGPAPELPLEEYAHRVIRQLEHHTGLTTALTRRLALLEAELGILGRIVETVQGSGGETVLGEMLHRCLDAAGVSRGAAYLLEDGRLALRARLGYTEAEVGLLADHFGHAELLHRTLADGEPVEIRASAGGPGQAEELLARSRAQSMLLAPLILGEKRLGIIQMASANRELSRDWLAFARTMGSQIAQALELSRTLTRLSASERRYRDLVQGIDAVVWEADGQTGQITFLSPQAEKVFGYPPERWREQPNFRTDLIHPKDRDSVLDQMQTAIARGEDHDLEYRVDTADERLLWVHDKVQVSGGPGERLLRGVTVDVTARRQMEEQESRLRMAREVHLRSFPAGPPLLEGYDVAGLSVPAETTGGDYFDYIPMPAGHLGLPVGDVSGHGIAAALLMAQTRAYLRAYTRTSGDVSEILGLLNATLTEDIGRDYFVTMLLAQLHPATRSLTYASAGHTTGYVFDPAGIVRASLPSTGLPLGISPNAKFPHGEPLVLAPGELVLFLTDGVLEACAPDSTSFGADRALALVRGVRHHPAGQIVQELYQAVRAFSQNTPQTDDITAVVVKVG